MLPITARVPAAPAAGLKSPLPVAETQRLPILRRPEAPPGIKEAVTARRAPDSASGAFFLPFCFLPAIRSPGTAE